MSGQIIQKTMLAVVLLALLLLSHPFSIQLDKQNTYNYVGKSNHLFVHFYTDGCRHCARLAPHWNELVRMYHPVEGISMATLGCDRFSSLCIELDGTSTPGIQYFRPNEKVGITFDGERELGPLLEWVQNLTSFVPFAKPNCLLFAKPDEVAALTKDGGWAFVVVDSPVEPAFNHSEFRACETERPEIAFRAVSNVHFQSEADRLCHNDGKRCAFLSNGKDVVMYNDEIAADPLFAFLDVHVPSDL
jgi:thiol-disulfide isomerase/thioredoxin